MDEKMDGKGPIILLLSSPILSVLYSILGGCARGYAGPRLAALHSFRSAGVEDLEPGSR